jgi:hypothetical protein
MNDAQRQAAIQALQARRKARGLADPLNRLTAHIDRAIALGAEPVTNKESDQ